MVVDAELVDIIITYTHKKMGKFVVVFGVQVKGALSFGSPYIIPNVCIIEGNNYQNPITCLGIAYNFDDETGQLLDIASKDGLFD